MKKIFSFTKKKKNPSSTPDSGSVLSVGYDLKEKDLSKVHKAAFLGDVAKLKQLVKKNDINQLDKENRTALHIACASGHADVVQFLVESKAKLNLCDNQNKSALMKAVQGQHERCVNVLLENHAEPNLVDINGNTALHLAANIPAISTAMLLVENEADINAQNKEGFTPLAVSVREEHMEMAEFLLKEGADVNFLDKDRRSPLMLAAGNGQICMLQLLLRFDADITLKDTKGWSSDDYAVMNGHHPCSLLITEHGTKKNAMSLSQVSSKKRKALLGSPSHDVEAGFSLGGPATDKDDAEDNSQSESLSRVSKSAGDDWPSSGDDDDEPHLISKNAQKVNLRKLIASKKGEATPQPDRPLGGTESESESEDRVQRIPSLPKALPFNRALQHPVAPSPASFSKAPQRSSALLPKSSMLEDSTLDDDDDDDDDDNDGEEKRNDDEEDEEEDISDETDEDGDPPAPPTPDYENGVYKDNKRDFLSELGLEKGREEQDSLDSESLSEDPDKPLDVNLSSHTQEAQEEMSTVEEENKKDLFYIPSFLRGEGGNRMAVLEHRRSVVRTGACQLVANSGDDSGDELVPKGAAMDKESERARWEPLSVLSKLEGENEQKTGKDLMEELGLGNVDDLEDASDWDSASTASKRTLPGRRMVSPGLEEHPECSTPSVQDEDISPATAPTTHKHMDSGEGLPSTPPQTVPQPQPRARKMLLPKQESDDESDLESDNLTSSFSAAKTDNQLSNTAEHLATVGPGSAKWPPVARDNESNMKSDKQLQEEKDDAVDTGEVALSKPCFSGRVGSDSEKQNDELGNQQTLENRSEVVDGVPWERRYEKLWVALETKEAKSTFKNVAGELRERFGEILRSKTHTADVNAEEEPERAESAFPEEASSDEDEGDVIVRPTAMARRTVLLTIPEQRESGLEDTVTESTNNSQCEDRRTHHEVSTAHSPDLPPDDDLEECRSPSPQLPGNNAESERITATDIPDHHSTPASDLHHKEHLNDRAKLEPHRTPQLELSLKDNAVEGDKAEKNHSRSEEDPDESSHIQPLSLSIHSAAIPDVSHKDLEEDVEKFKQEVDQERTQSAIAAQISSVSRNPGATVLKGMHTEKPETGLQCQKEMSSPSGATPKEQQPTATGSAVQTLLSDSPKSTNGPPELLHLPLQQTSSFKQEGEAVAVEETSQVRGARRSRAPQTSVHVNGDPLSVFDDSTLSEVSDDDGRLSSGDQHKNEAPGEMEMAEDFDELTQSSDTATDDIDSPTNSGYRHASLLIQKLDSTTLDSRSMVKLQNIFHEYERSIQKTRSRHWYLTEKVNQMELERTELKSSLEETKDMKSVLERNQLELQTEVTNLKFQLKQEQENRRNATMMYNTSRDKLKRIEEHQQVEIQERQKVELTLRNLELENRTLANNIKQLEEDHSETQRLLAQERSARTLQENLLNSHLRKQQEMEQESKIHLSKSNEALSQLTEASDREKELLQQSGLLKEELSILKSDRERSQANSRLKESHLVEENEVLKEQLEDARRDLKLNNEALTQAAFNYNNQLATLKSDLAVTTTRLENERQARETADTEVETARNRQVGSIQEAERCLADKADTERALLREKEDHQRLKDKLTSEAASQRDTVSSLSQNLSKAEAHANSLDNELHRATLQLTEKGLLLDVLQREKDQAAARGKELETTLQAEREQVSRAGARQEATQERLVQAQSESMLLRQQLEEAQNKGVAKERAVTDAQDRFGDMLSKLRSDCDERVQLVEEKSKDLASKAADLREQVYKLEEEKNDKESGLRQLQQELADSLKKLSMSEATLEVNTRYRNDLEEEKSRLQKEIDRVKEKLQEREDQYVQAERRINSLRGNVDAKERELGTAAQKLQEALSTSAGSDTTIKQLEDAVQGLEIENARLEAAAKQQSHKIEALQKGAQEGAMLTDGSPGGGVRSHLEDLITNLQSSKMTLEDQLNQEVQKQSMLSHTAQDSQALWEEEMKSRSKLGLRLAELEKEKGELNTQVEIERMKASKMAEQKSASDSRLDQEMKRNTDLHKEMYRLRSLLKTAKKKLHDQDSGGTEFGSPRSRMESGRHSQAEGGFGQMQEKVDDLQGQLRKEASHCSQLERLNRELKEELVSLKNPSHNNDQQERSKRQLEEEIAGARRQLESQAEQYRREAEERARQEVLQKLGQVNLFLQSQAASQDEVDQIKAANEANLRSRLDQVTRELEKERGRARKSEQDSLSQRDTTRTELDRYHHLYDEELQRRKSLAAKLDRSNSRLAEANSLLLNERSKPLFASSFANSGLGGPPLGVSSLGSLGSTTHYGGTRGPLTKSLGLGLAAEGQGTRVEDLLSEMQSELARATSRELNKAKAELDNGSSPGSFGVELDPLLRVKKEYLDVLKKNYSI
ncbi:ankyrin repeat domain-containing protein 26 isoform X3 [Genypterus blacodes]|uniref:ankyrin repeat domain-containing protein 26 isoform X3 n=1 Tax=Genypterus blacodes TaxID=154954 RepID=UPI003F777E40